MLWLRSTDLRIFQNLPGFWRWGSIQWYVIIWAWSPSSLSALNRVTGVSLSLSVYIFSEETFAVVERDAPFFQVNDRTSSVHVNVWRYLRKHKNLIVCVIVVFIKCCLYTVSWINEECSLEMILDSPEQTPASLAFTLEVSLDSADRVRDLYSASSVGLQRVAVSWNCSEYSYGSVPLHK